MKFGRNYDTEIMELNQKTNYLDQKTTGLRTDTDDNRTEIISIGNEFCKYKLEMNKIVKSLLDDQKCLLKECSELKVALTNLKNEKKVEMEVKSEMPDIMTCYDICAEITDVKYLNPTSLKYYLYELGLLTLNINKRLNTYKAVSNYKEIHTDISQYMHVKGRVITFDKGVIDYLKKHSEDLQNSIDRYLRKNIQYSKSKDRIDALKVKNYQTEICNICGTDSNGNYDATKWGQIYSRYSIEHKNWRNEYNKWADNYMVEHPRAKYRPTQITYLVQKVGDGDILLKIACELFVA